MDDAAPLDGRPGKPAIGWLLASAGERAASTFRALLPESVHPRQFAVLSLVAGAARPLSQAEASRALGIPASRVVAIVDQLENDDLIARQPDEHDRRTRRLVVTDRGRQLLASLTETAERANDEVVEGLTASEREQLRGLLTKIVGHPHVW